MIKKVLKGFVAFAVEYSLKKVKGFHAEVKKTKKENKSLEQEFKDILMKTQTVESQSKYVIVKCGDIYGVMDTECDYSESKKYILYTTKKYTSALDMCWYWIDKDQMEQLAKQRNLWTTVDLQQKPFSPELDAIIKAENIKIVRYDNLYGFIDLDHKRPEIKDVSASFNKVIEKANNSLEYSAI